VGCNRYHQEDCDKRVRPKQNRWGEVPHFAQNRAVQYEEINASEEKDVNRPADFPRVPEQDHTQINRRDEEQSNTESLGEPH
jgi:hypothetical protein